MNFELTRLEALRRCAQARGLTLCCVDARTFQETDFGSGNLVWIPYLTYEHLPADVFNDVLARNRVIITGGDEVLDGAWLRPLCAKIGAFYVALNQDLWKDWRTLLGDRLLLLPEGFAPDFPERAPCREKVAVYIGSPFKGRIDILSGLDAAGVKIEIYGPKRWISTSLAHRYRGFIENRDYFFRIASAQIFLALASGDTAFDTHPNAKLGDALRAGTICLTERAQGLEGDFKVASDLIIWCSSIDEFVGRANDVLTLDDGRYQERVDSAREAARETILNYDVSLLRLIDAVLSAGATPLPTGGIKVSPFLKFLQTIGVIVLDESRLAAFVAGANEAPGHSKSYLTATAELWLFGRRLRVPARISLIAYCRRLGRYAVRLRFKDRDGTPSPDLKAVSIHVPPRKRILR